MFASLLKVIVCKIYFVYLELFFSGLRFRNFFENFFYIPPRGYFAFFFIHILVL